MAVGLADAMELLLRSNVGEADPLYSFRFVPSEGASDRSLLGDSLKSDVAALGCELMNVDGIVE